MLPARMAFPLNDIDYGPTFCLNLFFSFLCGAFLFRLYNDFLIHTVVNFKGGIAKPDFGILNIERHDPLKCRDTAGDRITLGGFPNSE